MKFALNLAPAAGDLTRSRARTLANPEGTTVGELTGLPFARRGTDGHLHFVFLRRKATGMPGVSYRVEFSDRLTGGWAVNPVAATAILEVDATWERVIIQDIVAGPRPSSRFVRLRIEAE
ncbi:MAG: hypothetical protein JWM59_2784 [Verrucomicrobiales bacterium]|nr:hypothetical protein [Verrucomicrobiales bacterium]